MPRRRKKEPSVEGVIFALLALTFLGIKISGVTWAAVLSLIFKCFIILSIVAVIILFIKNLIKSSQSQEFKLQSPQVENNKISHSTSQVVVSSVTKKIESKVGWSEELIHKVEWRVFEKLCMGLWRAKGFDVEETSSGADGGVDFYLRARETNKRIGAVQCKSWSSKQVDVKTVRELQGVIASENLQLGLLMYSGVLSKPAKEFIAKPSVTVKEQGVSEIYKQICLLPEEKKAELLNEITRGDYLSPSCPKCDVKMIERTAKQTGNKFLGCPNFPSCRHTMRTISK